LTFANPADYDQIKDGDVLIVEDIQEVLARETNTARLRAIIWAGGLLNFTRTGGKA
jgi:hypothetical protein